MIINLNESINRTYAIADISFFARWWSEAATKEEKSLTKYLVENK
jgi:hypothetical protein